MGPLKNTVAVHRGGVEVRAKVVGVRDFERETRESLAGRAARLDSELEKTRAHLGARGEPRDFEAAHSLLRSNWRAAISPLGVLPDLKRAIPDPDKVVEVGYFKDSTRQQVREYYAARFKTVERLAAHCLCRQCGSPLGPCTTTGLGPCGLTAEEMQMLRPYWNSRLNRCSARDGCSHGTDSELSRAACQPHRKRRSDDEVLKGS